MDSAIMSAMHSSHLHGQGPRTKHKYNYSRQRVQESQKVKPEDSVPSKATKEESSPKPPRSSNGVVLILVLMIGVTWGIAATSYFGVVDYKALIDQCYDAYFNEDPYEIIDKRRPVTGTSPSRQMKRSLDAVTKDKVEEPPAVDVPAPETEDVGKGKEPQSQQQEQPEETKQSEDKPKPDAEPESSTKSKQADKKGDESKPKEDKDIALTLYLQLFVGNQPALNERHQISEYSAIIRVNTAEESYEIGSFKDFSKQQIEIDADDNSTECPLHGWNVTKVSPGATPVNKLSEMAPVRNPLVPRLVLVGSVVNRKGYAAKSSFSEPKQQKIGAFSRPVANTTPCPTKWRKNENVDVKINDENAEKGIPNTKNRAGVERQELFTQKLGKIVVLNPSGVGDDFVADNLENDDISALHSKNCGRLCTLGLKFVNRYAPEDIESDGEVEDNFDGRISVSDFLLNKIHDLEQKITENERIDGLFSKVALPNPVNKDIHKSSQGNGEKNTGESRSYHPKVTLQSTLNKNPQRPVRGRDTQPLVQVQHPGVRIARPNTISKTFVLDQTGAEEVSHTPVNPYDQCKDCRVALPNTMNKKNLSVEEVGDEKPLSVGAYKSMVQNCQVPYKDDNLNRVPPKSKTKRERAGAKNTSKPGTVSGDSSTEFSKGRATEETKKQDGAVGKRNERSNSAKKLTNSKAKTKPTKQEKKIEKVDAGRKKSERSNMAKTKTKNVKTKPDVVQEARKVVAEVVSGRVITQRQKSNSTRTISRPVTGTAVNKFMPTPLRDTLVKARGQGTISTRVIQRIDQESYSTKTLFSRIISDNVDIQIRTVLRYVSGNEQKPKKMYKWEGKKRTLPKRGARIDLGAPKTPKAKLKRMLSLFYEKSKNYTAEVVTYIKNAERLNACIKMIESKMPTFVINFTRKVKNSTTFVKVSNIVANTTVSDAFRFVKSNSERGWSLIRAKGSYFYQKIANKPGIKVALSKFSRFAKKMKLKFQKFTDFVKQNIVTNQMSQKLVALFLLVLALVGLYHMFALMFNSTF